QPVRRERRPGGKGVDQVELVLLGLLGAGEQLRTEGGGGRRRRRGVGRWLGGGGRRGMFRRLDDGRSAHGRFGDRSRRLVQPLLEPAAGLVQQQGGARLALADLVGEI